MQMQVPIDEVMPNTARCAYHDYSQKTFDELSTDEQDQLYALARSIGGDDGPVQLPVIEKLKAPVGGKKYRCRDGDRRILATSVILGQRAVTVIERSFTASYALTALAAQGQRRSLSPYDRLRNYYEAVETDGNARVIEESGIGKATLFVYLSTWRGLAAKTKEYCKKHAERLTTDLMTKSVGGDRRGNAEGQIAFLEEKLFGKTKNKAGGKAARKMFKAERVGKVLDQVLKKMLETADNKAEREMVIMTMQTIHAELARLLPPKPPEESTARETPRSKAPTRKRSIAKKTRALKKAPAKRKSPAREKAAAKRKSPARKKSPAKDKAAAKGSTPSNGKVATLGDLKNLMDDGRASAKG